MSRIIQIAAAKVMTENNAAPGTMLPDRAVRALIQGKAGTAISYGLGQGATLVSALWGILVWREFKGAPKKAAILNVSMFVLFLVGLGLIIAAG